MTDERAHETTAAPKPKKNRRKPARRAPPAPKPADGIYAGLTVKDCATACNANGCVISGKPYCAHPRKGGLHAAEQEDSDAMHRRTAAERVLGKLKLVIDE